jgi:hypothetical protein
MKGRNYLEDLGIDERLIFKWILKKYGVRMWNGFRGFRIGSSGGIL